MDPVVTAVSRSPTHSLAKPNQHSIRLSAGLGVEGDAHQGATAYYDGQAFFADPRLHRTLLWMVMLWLALVLGALPLRVARRVWHPIDETAYVEASARYFAAVVPPNATAQRLIESFLRGLHIENDSDPESALWERFDADPRVSAAQQAL